MMGALVILAVGIVVGFIWGEDIVEFLKNL